ncbi:MAG TPA: MFS transporter [Candidatus Sulfomarinibacteraceae bacterium]|nr:MFS transporter [Candidatus Sulfomarinibacteraceae bacterium]
MTPAPRLSGMRAFIIVALGQVASLLGTGMTGFALTIWAFGETGRATDLALIGFFFITPMLVLSPTAGALVDRHDRKLMMMLSDLASGVTTIVVLVLYSSGALEIWHLYFTSAVSGSYQAFQWPAFSAAISVMLPTEQYARAHGITSLGESASGILAPLLAGALLGLLGLSFILIVDIITFVVAIGALLLVHIPSPPRTESGEDGQGNIWRESLYGFRYIFRRPSLLGLQIVFMAGNFLAGVGLTLMAPMILARTGNNELIFGSVQSIGAAGGVAGGLLMSIWGGPRRLVHGVLLGWLASSLLGSVLMGLGQGAVIWAIAAFFLSFFVPVINGSNQAIWQAKVAPDVQGRVFSVRRLIAWFSAPLSRLVAGPLADNLFEPAMMSGGALVDSFGRLVGTGPGAGMSLILVFSGLLAALVSVAGYLTPLVRNVEELLPDHIAVEGVGPEEAAVAG